MRCGPSWKISPTLATAVAASGSSGPCSSPSAASPRMTWSISAGEKPVISIGASNRINSSNSIFNASRSHSPFSARRLTASLSTRCSSGLRCPMRTQGTPVKAQLLGGFAADFAVDDLVVATHEERNAKAQGADRGSNLPNMSGIEFADFSRRRPKVSDPNVGKLQAREDVVSPRACGRSLGQSLLLVTAIAALSAQLLGKSGPKRNRIRAISHRPSPLSNKTKPVTPVFQARKDPFGADCP